VSAGWWCWRCVAVTTAVARLRGEQRRWCLSYIRSTTMAQFHWNETKWHREERKGNARFPNPAYICRFAGHTYQPCAPYIHRWCHVIDEYSARIFIGDVVTLMNLCGRSKSNRTARIFISEPIYSSVWVPTFILAPMNESLFSIVITFFAKSINASNPLIYALQRRDRYIKLQSDDIYI
jgi:hypothetical protein